MAGAMLDVNDDFDQLERRFEQQYEAGTSVALQYRGGTNSYTSWDG